MVEHVMDGDTDSSAEAERWRSEARQARQRASSARELALDIERHRDRVVRRDDASTARHRPEIWSSRAATASRTELQRSVGFSLWLASESLHDTRVALEGDAVHQDALARNYDTQAAAVGESVG